MRRILLFAALQTGHGSFAPALPCQPTPEPHEISAAPSFKPNRSPEMRTQSSPGPLEGGGEASGWAPDRNGPSLSGARIEPGCGWRCGEGGEVDCDRTTRREIDEGKRVVGGAGGADVVGSGAGIGRDQGLVWNAVEGRSKFDQGAGVLHLAAAGEIEGFLPGAAGAEFAWIAACPELEDAVGAVGVAARPGEERPVGRFARVPVGEVAEFGLPIDWVVLVAGFRVQDRLDWAAVVVASIIW